MEERSFGTRHPCPPPLWCHQVMHPMQNSGRPPPPSPQDDVKEGIFMTFLRNIFICDARAKGGCAFWNSYYLSTFPCSILLEHPLQILKEHKKTSYSDMTPYLCLKRGLCRRFRSKRNLIVVKGWILESKAKAQYLGIRKRVYSPLQVVLLFGCSCNRLLF